MTKEDYEEGEWQCPMSAYKGQWIPRKRDEIDDLVDSILKVVRGCIDYPDYHFDPEDAKPGIRKLLQEIK